MPAYDRVREDRFPGRLREHLGEGRFAAAWAAGWSLRVPADGSMRERLAELRRALAGDEARRDTGAG